jgi:hypothetical protein
MLQKFLSVFALMTMCVIVSCTDQNPNTSDKNPSGAGTISQAPAAPVSGKTAFWEMYKSAHAWASDLEPLRLESKSIPGIQNADGKAAMWRATFGSPGKRQARIFTYAVAPHSPDVYKGVTVGQPLPWNGPTKDAAAFDGSDLMVDSDAAYKTALTKAVDWVGKHPGKEVSCTLGNAARFQAPVWYVLWGDAKSGYAVFVDAKSGTVVNQRN